MICMLSLRTLQISACLQTWRSHAMHVGVRCRLTARRTRSNGPASAVIPVPTNLSHRFLHHLAVQRAFRKPSLLDTEQYAPARSLGPPAPPLPAANHRHGCLPQRSVARLQRQHCLPQYALSAAFSPAIAADQVGCSSSPSIVIRTSFWGSYATQRYPWFWPQASRSALNLDWNRFKSLPPGAHDYWVARVNFGRLLARGPVRIGLVDLRQSMRAATRYKACSQYIRIFDVLSFGIHARSGPCSDA